MITLAAGASRYTGRRAGPLSMNRSFHALLCAVVIAACGESHAAATDSTRADSVSRAWRDSTNRAQPGYVVDSVLPMEEQVRRFRAGLSKPPDGLENGATSRDALVRAFIQSLEKADTAALIRLTISRAEFAYHVFPESPFASGPFEQAPGIVWMRHAASSATGLRRLLERSSGQSLAFKSWSCGGDAVDEGANRIWKDCVVHLSSATESRSLQLFSGIIERAGRFKILSYANAF